MKLSLSLQQDFTAPELVLKRAFIKKVIETTLRYIEVDQNCEIEEVLAMLDAWPMGDLVICIPVVLQEAVEQHKTPIEHFTHMLVHGTLHLMGYDHETSEQDAEDMEALEIQILAKLGFNNPYQLQES